MVKCNSCRNEDGTLFSALESIVWYDGHYDWLKELRDALVEHRKENHYSMPDDIEWHTEKHTIWMLLVGMFGNWGTSIRGGWIENMDSCVEFIDALCKHSWEADDGK